MSDTERRVWFRLRRRNIAGKKFRRQYPIGPYFADFACISNRLVVEIDGALHEDPIRDQRKTEYLEALGWRVVSFPASETDRHLDDIIESIWLELSALGSPP